MYRQIKTALHRSHETLLSDLIGGAALMVTLLGGLYLPAFF